MKAVPATDLKPINFVLTLSDGSKARKYNYLVKFKRPTINETIPEPKEQPQPRPKRPITALIQSISNRGEVTLEFSEAMNTFGVDLAMINSSAIEMYVMPDLATRDDSLNSSSLNFTWKVVEYNTTKMKIQIKFADSRVISSRGSFDSLVWRAKGEHEFEFFKPAIGDAYLNHTTLHIIPKQLAVSDSLDQLLSMAQVV